jgi:hypothetical protein
MCPVLPADHHRVYEICGYYIAKGMGHSEKSFFAFTPGALLTAHCFIILALMSKPLWT